METITKVIGAVIFISIVILVFAIILAIPTYYLWNWLMPDIFKLSEITFWQALGLNLLTGILFRSGNSSSKKD